MRQIPIPTVVRSIGFGILAALGGAVSGITDIPDVTGWEHILIGVAVAAIYATDKEGT